MFKILCRRSAASMLGAATAYAKGVDKKELVFKTRSEAEATVKRWTAGAISGKVTYSVVELED